MSIIHIQTSKKIEVLLRLLENKENLKDASSKAGLNLKQSKLILTKQSI